jgi:O-acetyl-ADP-ribose deacetylase (regulator of RNase III)
LISFSLGTLTLEIADGDIAAETTDAIVNAANNHFWMGSGVRRREQQHHPRRLEQRLDEARVVQAAEAQRGGCRRNT